MDSVRSEINTAQFPVLDFWTSDSTRFEKGVLKDVMHLSEYGWYKADRFISEQYRLGR